MGTGVEGAGGDYERFSDGHLEDAENEVSGGRAREENHGEGDQVDPSAGAG